MAGIGKYTKGKKFELKSGNNPAFKMIAGDSPITNEFGIGKGTSPYREEYSTTDDPNMTNNIDTSKQSKAKGKGGGWKKAAQIALAGLTSGLDAVYGSGKIMPEGVKFSSDKKKKKCTDQDGNVVKCP
jgi:hypothetical protein